MSRREVANSPEGPGGHPEYGLHVTVSRNPDAPESIDIVAVHGLNGHWKTTWTDENTDTNWLRDCIPGRIPTARVMSFSYDSVQLTKSLADVPDFAEQLLDNLSSRRISETEQGRPIIFICHSLGGILFKQAYNRVVEDGSPYEHLCGNIKGVIFFGTPHRGPSTFSTTQPLGNIIKACGLNNVTEAHLLEDLETKSSVLDRVSRSFLKKCSKLDICSFYELDKMALMSTLVVEHNSAILGLQDEMTIPLSGTHQTICQFTMVDVRLNKVLEQLCIISSFWLRQVQVTQQRLQSQHRVLDQLGKSDHRMHKEEIPASIPGTCSWLLGHPDYQKWCEETGPALMWFSAHPGYGKSVMMSSLIDTYEKREKRDDTHICYWFFKDGDNEQANPLVAIRGLLRQILESRPSALRAVSEYLEGKDPTDLKVIWTAFTIAIGNKAIDRQRPTYMDRSGQNDDSKTLCFIDGIDKCQLEGRTTLMLLISSYFGSSKQPKTTSGRLKMLIASRPDNWIKVAFDKLQPPATQHHRSQKVSECCCAIRLEGESETENISADVSLVVKYSIQKLMRQQGLPQKLLEEVERRLIAKADRGFLWAILTLQLFLRKIEISASQQEIDKDLESRTLGSVFTDLLSSLPDAPRTRKLFSVMLAATRPLTIQELGIVLALTPENDCLSASSKPFRPGPRTCDDLENGLVYPFEDHIRSVGGPLIRITRCRVYFVHETAREFLLMDEYEKSDTSPLTGYSRFDIPQQPMPSSWGHSMSLTSCHALLMDICVTYLYRVGKLGIKSSLDFVGDVSGFLDYASKSWCTHFQQVADEIQLQNVPYYHNLCHPAFPGFTIWTDQCWGGDHNPLFGFSAEEQQDYYIQYFGVEVGQENRRNAKLLIRQYEDEGMSSYPNSNVQHSFLSFSSNPTVLGGHSFPARADENGFVSLDFRLA